MSRRRLRLIAPAALLALGVAACGGSSDSGDTGKKAGDTGNAKLQEGGSLTFGSDQEPTGFNTLTSKDNGTAARNVTIMIYPEAFVAQPDVTVKMNEDLLESAELTKEDPETVVYKIKEAAKWSDGTPITANDFTYIWENLNGTKTDNDVASTTGYEDIGSVEGSDNGKTVTVTFKTVFPDWKALFDQLLPAHIMKDIPGGWNDGLNTAVPFSGGPYKLESFTPGNNLRVVPNDAWYGKTKPKLDDITFRFLPESQTQPDALKNNEVQMIYTQPQLDLVQQVKSIQGVKNETGFGVVFEHFDFNVTNPMLADLQVRKAIAQGLDINAIVDAGVKQFSDKAAPLGNRIYMPSQPDYKDNAPKDMLKGDAAAAGQTLEAAGWAKGADGIYAKGGQRLSLRFSTTSGNALRENQGVIFQAQMKKAGIDIRLDNSPSKVLFGERLPGGDFDITDFAWVGTPFPVSSSKAIYITGGDSNYGKYSSPKVDDLLNKASSELDEKKAADLANQADQQIWADLATIPLYQKATFLAFYDKYGGIVDNPTSDGPFFNADTWGVKAQ